MIFSIDFWQTVFIAMISVFFVMKFLRPIAIRINLVDAPDKRKQHEGNVPLIGGVSVYVGLMIAMFSSYPFNENLSYLLIAASLILVVGIIDDLRNLGVWLRLFFQIIACLIMIKGSGVHISSLGSPFGSNEIMLGVFSVPFTIFAVVGLVNAFNMSDGIDGLAGSLALVTIIGIILFGAMSETPLLFLLLAGLAAALIPYLFANVIATKKVFLGDAGSMLIGFILAWVLVILSQDEAKSMVPTSVLWCVAFPVIDTLSVCCRRIRTGKSPLNADREHFHHLLLDSGITAKKSLLIILICAVGFLSLGLLVQNFWPSASLSIFIATALIYLCWSSRFLEKTRCS